MLELYSAWLERFENGSVVDTSTTSSTTVAPSISVQPLSHVVNADPVAVSVFRDEHHSFQDKLMIREISWRRPPRGSLPIAVSKTSVIGGRKTSSKGFEFVEEAVAWVKAQYGDLWPMHVCCSSGDGRYGRNSYRRLNGQVTVFPEISARVATWGNLNEDEE